MLNAETETFALVTRCRISAKLSVFLTSNSPAARTRFSTSVMDDVTSNTAGFYHHSGSSGFSPCIDRGLQGSTAQPRCRRSGADRRYALKETRRRTGPTPRRRNERSCGRSTVSHGWTNLREVRVLNVLAMVRAISSL